MHLNSVYRKVTLKMLIRRRQNYDLNKGVAFSYNLVTVYKKSVKNSPRVTEMKN